MFDVLLDDVCGQLQLLFDMFFGHETIAVDALALVDPEFGDLVCVLVVLRFCLQDTQEHAGQVADIEFVVEVGGGLFELVHYFLMEDQCAFTEAFGFVEDVFIEVFEVVGDECLVDADHGLVVGQHDLQDPEVTHETRVDLEDTRSRVHSRDLHCVRDRLQFHFFAVLPVALVDALADERDRRLCVIRVGSWHVQVVNEVEQNCVTASQWLEGLSLLLEHTFELQLQTDAVCVKVEINGFVAVLVFRQFLEDAVDELRFTRACRTDDQSGLFDGNEFLHEV